MTELIFSGMFNLKPPIAIRDICLSRFDLIPVEASEMRSTVQWGLEDSPANQAPVNHLGHNDSI